MGPEQIRRMVEAYADAAGWPQSDACLGVFNAVCWQKRGIKKKASEYYPKAYAGPTAGALVWLDRIARLYWDPVKDRVWFHFEREVPHDPLLERLLTDDAHWSRDAIVTAWRDAEADYRRNRTFHASMGKTERLGPKETR